MWPEGAPDISALRCTLQRDPIRKILPAKNFTKSSQLISEAVLIWDSELWVMNKAQTSHFYSVLKVMGVGSGVPTLIIWNKRHPPHTHTSSATISKFCGISEILRVKWRGEFLWVHLFSLCCFPPILGHERFSAVKICLKIWASSQHLELAMLELTIWGGV